MTYNDPTRGQTDNHGLDIPEHISATMFLMGWVEKQVGFASVSAIGFRVVLGNHLRPSQML